MKYNTTNHTTQRNIIKKIIKYVNSLLLISIVQHTLLADHPDQLLKMCKNYYLKITKMTINKEEKLWKQNGEKGPQLSVPVHCMAAEKQQDM